MFMKSLSLVAVIGLSLSVAMPVSAQNSNAVNSAKIEVLERQVRMLRSRMGMKPETLQADGVAAANNPRLVADLSAKIGSLETQIRRLTGRLEEFEYRQRQMREEIELLQKEMALQRQELMNGVAEQSKAPMQGAAEPAEGGAASDAGDGGQSLAPVEAVEITVELPGGSAAEQFDFAFAFVKKNDLKRGQLAFEKFIAANPGDSRVGNAKFWLGRIHLNEGRNAQAAQYLLALIEEHPNHAKRPDALVDLASVLIKLDSAGDACNALTEFRRVESKASVRLRARAKRVGATARCN